MTDFERSLDIVWETALLNKSWRTKIFTLRLEDEFCDMLLPMEIESLASTIVVEFVTSDPSDQQNRFWECACRMPTTENVTMIDTMNGGNVEQ